MHPLEGLLPAPAGPTRFPPHLPACSANDRRSARIILLSGEYTHVHAPHRARRSNRPPRAAARQRACPRPPGPRRPVRRLGPRPEPQPQRPAQPPALRRLPRRRQGGRHRRDHPRGRQRRGARTPRLQHPRDQGGIPLGNHSHGRSQGEEAPTRHDRAAGRTRQVQGRHPRRHAAGLPRRSACRQVGRQQPAQLRRRRPDRDRREGAEQRCRTGSARRDQHHHQRRHRQPHRRRLLRLQGEKRPAHLAQLSGQQHRQPADARPRGLQQQGRADRRQSQLPEWRRAGRLHRGRRRRLSGARLPVHAHLPPAHSRRPAGRSVRSRLSSVHHHRAVDRLRLSLGDRTGQDGGRHGLWPKPPRRQARPDRHGRRRRAGEDHGQGHGPGGRAGQAHLLRAGDAAGRVSGRI